MAAQVPAAAQVPVSWRVILTQGPCECPLDRSNFSICPEGLSHGGSMQEALHGLAAGVRVRVT